MPKVGASKRRNNIRTHHNNESSNHLTGNVFLKKQEAGLSMLKHYIDLDVENTGEVKQLVKDGVWQVPIEARPKGWEKLGLKEKG